MADLTESLVGGAGSGWYTQFKPSEWATISPDERLGLLQEAENRAAEEQCRLARRIVSKKMEGDQEGWDGKYNPEEPGIIYINEDLVNSTVLDDATGMPGYCAATALLTVYHEGRHAFQDDCTQNRCAVVNGKLRAGRLLRDLAKEQGIVDDETLELWEMQRHAYFRPAQKDQTDESLFQELLYSFQPKEDDAEAFSLGKLNEMAELLGDEIFRFRVDIKKRVRCDLELEALFSLGLDFRKTVADEIREKHALLSKKDIDAQEGPGSSGPADLPQKRKYNVLQYAMMGGSLVLLFLMYWIADPSGLLQHLLWFMSVSVPFLPVVLLLRKFPFLRSKKGGIALLALSGVLLLLIQAIYFWLMIAYFVVGTLFLARGFSNAMPDLYTVTLEHGDGTTTTETHVLGSNPEQDISAIDAGYTSRGYKKK